ncbi:unnamed protein product [Paramecium primaurelia]|uniref:Uncharacterized protein n=1 Tax=Paramecium primaurelia TaxID=5886 RepID=A0A8S1KZK2_PARPR|nr:unnamed protein product [Paramecium primaurelia]
MKVLLQIQRKKTKLQNLNYYNYINKKWKMKKHQIKYNKNHKHSKLLNQIQKNSQIIDHKHKKEQDQKVIYSQKMIQMLNFFEENNPQRQDLDHIYQLKTMIKHQHNLIFLNERYLLNNIIEERNNQIAELKQLLQKEKNLCQQLKCEFQKQNTQRGELEVVLLDCVNYIKKDIASRQIVQKQPFLGNTNKTQKIAQQIAFEDIDYRQFTHQDKKALLKKFLSSEQFLDQIYQLTFNSQMASTSQLKLNEKWKQDANDATKKFNNFKIYKFRNITSQPIIKQVISKQESNILNDLHDQVDQDQELVDQIVQN